MSQSPYDPFTAPPPVGPTQPAPYQPAEPWRDNSGLVTALTILFTLIALTLLANIVGLVRRSLILDDPASFRPMSAAELQSVDLWVTVPTIIYLVLFLITAAVFIPWQYRHAKNARILGQTSGLGPGWAIGGWFIPLANFVLPALQLRGANRWSRDPRSRPGKPSVFILAWLGCLIVGNIVSRAAVAGEPNPAQGWRAYVKWIVISDRVEAAGALVLLAAAILALLMVRELSEQQEAQRPAPGASWSTPHYPWPGQQGGHPVQGGYGYPAPPGTSTGAAYPGSSSTDPGPPQASPWGAPPAQQPDQQRPPPDQQWPPPPEGGTPPERPHP